MKLLSWFFDQIFSEWTPTSPVLTKNIQLHIEEVGPFSGNAFGGIEAIQLFGCLANGKNMFVDNKNETEEETSYQQSAKRSRSFPDNDEFEDTRFDFHSPSADTKSDSNSSSLYAVVGCFVGVVVLAVIVAGVVVALQKRKKSVSFISDSPLVERRHSPIRSNSDDFSIIEVHQEQE